MDFPMPIDEQLLHMEGPMNTNEIPSMDYFSLYGTSQLSSKKEQYTEMFYTKVANKNVKLITLEPEQDMEDDELVEPKFLGGPVSVKRDFTWGLVWVTIGGLSLYLIYTGYYSKNLLPVLLAVIQLTLLFAYFP